MPSSNLAEQRSVWGIPMQESIIGLQKTVRDLKSGRKLVFVNFTRNPSNIRLALEIKVLDDRISDLDVALSKQRNSGVSHRQSMPAQLVAATPI